MTLSALLAKLDTDPGKRGREFERICRWVAWRMPLSTDASSVASALVRVAGCLGPDAGIDNDLFYEPNTSMLFSDAKQAASDIAAEVTEL